MVSNRINLDSVKYNLFLVLSFTSFFVSLFYNGKQYITRSHFDIFSLFSNQQRVFLYREEVYLEPVVLKPSNVDLSFFHISPLLWIFPEIFRFDASTFNQLAINIDLSNPTDRSFDHVYQTLFWSQVTYQFRLPPKYILSIFKTVFTNNHSELFLGKGALKIRSKFTREHTWRSVISIKFLCNFIEIALWHGCSPVNLLHIFRTYFPRNTSGRLLMSFKLLWLTLRLPPLWKIFLHNKKMLKVRNNDKSTILMITALLFLIADFGKN